MAKADPKQYAASLAWYEKLVATNPKVERKGATMPYTSLNGHMFSLLTRELRAEPAGVTLFYAGLVGMIAASERCAGNVSQKVPD